MKLLKLCWLPVLLMAMFLFGCSSEKVPSNEGEERKAKRFEELKGLPLDTVLTRAYKFYEQFQATGDTLQRDSMDDYRNHFFARWKLSSDSLCGTVAPDDSLAADLRDIYKAVLEFDAKRKYRDILDREERDTLEDTLNETRKNAKPIDPIDIADFIKKWKEDPDFWRKLFDGADSIKDAKTRPIPFDEALKHLKEDSSSSYNRAYFVQTLQVRYVDIEGIDMKELEKFRMYWIEQEEWKKTNSACMEKAPTGQRILVLNKEYNTLLNVFMKANVHESRQERYTIKPNKYPFWFPFIDVFPHHGDDYYHFNSFPIMDNAVFNKAHDMVKLDVMESFNFLSHYYLSKRSGKWEVVKRRDGWVM